MPDFVQQFHSIPELELPDIYELGDDRLRVFWILHAAKVGLGEPWMTPSEISLVLRDAFGIEASRQRVQGILAAEKGTVARREANGRQLFQIMRSGSDELTAARSIIFIDPANALSRLRQVQELLGELRGCVRICDPYVSSETIDMLTHLDGATDIKLLTMTVRNEGRVRRDLKAFDAEYKTPLDIRTGSKGKLHDRYVIHEDGMVLVGTSLNSIGLKQSFVVIIGDDVRAAVTTAFDQAWTSATPFT